MNSPRLLRVLTMISLLGAATSLTPAQSVSSAFSQDSTASAQADADAMIDRALDGFKARGETFIEKKLAVKEREESSKTTRDELRSLLENRVTELREFMRAEIQPLRMDGLLAVDEATDVLGRVGDSEWLSFVETVEAKVRGYSTPPRLREYERSSAYSWNLLKYTLSERNGVTSYAILLGAVAIGILLAWFCSLGLSHLRSYLQDQNYDTATSLVGGVHGPVYVTLALAGFAIGLDHFWIPQAAQEFLDPALQLGFLAALLWLFWALASLLAQAIGWMLKTTYRKPDQQMVAVIRKSLQLAVFCIFAIIIARTVFDVTLPNVLLGVGLLGIAISLAAQDSLKNLFGSVTIVFDQPYKVGDLIEFRGFFGHVEDIGFRSTKVREFDGHLVTIPNADIVREPVQNIDARPWIRRRFRLGLRYDTPPAKVREAIDILEDILSGRDNEPEEMKTHIVFEKFGESNLVLLVQYSVEPGEYWDALKKGSEYHLQILDRFNEAGIEFAFPTQTNVLETTEAHPAKLNNALPRADENGDKHDEE